MQPKDFQIVYVPCGTLEEARKIGRDLVEQRLAACANILPKMKSLYAWQGRLVEEDEILLLMKVRSEKLPSVRDRITALHSYECPCIVSWALQSGNTPYLQWLRDATE